MGSELTPSNPADSSPSRAAASDAAAVASSQSVWPKEGVTPWEVIRSTNAAAPGSSGA